MNTKLIMLLNFILSSQVTHTQNNINIINPQPQQHVVYNLPQPVYDPSQQQIGYNSLQPVYNLSQPIYNHPQPVYNPSQQQVGYNPSQPQHNNVSPNNTDDLLKITTTWGKVNAYHLNVKKYEIFQNLLRLLLKVNAESLDNKALTYYPEFEKYQVSNAIVAHHLKTNPECYFWTPLLFNILGGLLINEYNNDESYDPYKNYKGYPIRGDLCVGFLTLDFMFNALIHCRTYNKIDNHPILMSVIRNIWTIVCGFKLLRESLESEKFNRCHIRKIIEHNPHFLMYIGITRLLNEIFSFINNQKCLEIYTRYMRKLHPECMIIQNNLYIRLNSPDHTSFKIQDTFEDLVSFLY